MAIAAATGVHAAEVEAVVATVAANVVEDGAASSVVAAVTEVASEGAAVLPGSLQGTY